MNQLDWEDVKLILEQQLKIPCAILDYIAVKDILQLCASGSSNSVIASFTNLDVDYVIRVIEDMFRYPGWNSDLDYNPYMIYKTCNGNHDDYVNELQILRPTCKLKEIKLSFLIASRYANIENKLEKYWI